MSNNLNESTNSSIIDQFFSQFFGDNEEEEDGDFQLDFLDDIPFDSLQHFSSDPTHDIHASTTTSDLQMNFFESDDEEVDVDEFIDVAELQEIKHQTELFTGHPILFAGNEPSTHFQTRRSTNKTGMTPEKPPRSVIDFTSSSSATVDAVQEAEQEDSSSEDEEEDSPALYSQFLKYFETKQEEDLLAEEEDKEFVVVGRLEHENIFEAQEEEYNGVIFIHEFNPVENRIWSDRSEFEEFRDDPGVQVSVKEVLDLLEDCSEFLRGNSSTSTTVETTSSTSSTAKRSLENAKNLTTILELREKYANKVKDTSTVVKKKRGRPRKEPTVPMSSVIPPPPPPVEPTAPQQPSPVEVIVPLAPVESTAPQETTESSTTTTSSNQPTAPPPLTFPSSTPISIIIEPPFVNNTDINNNNLAVAPQPSDFVPIPSVSTLSMPFTSFEREPTASMTLLREQIMQQLCLNIQITIHLYLICKEIHFQDQTKDGRIPLCEKGPNSPGNAIHIAYRLKNQLIQFKQVLQQLGGFVLDIPAFCNDQLFYQFLSFLDGPIIQARHKMDFQIKQILLQFIFNQRSLPHFDHTMFSEMMSLLNLYKKGDFKHVVERLRFTAAEDDLLAMGLDRFGHSKWKQIQEMYLPTKEIKQIENRFKNMRGTRGTTNHPIKQYKEVKKRPRDEGFREAKPIQLTDYSNEIITSLKNQNRNAVKTSLNALQPHHLSSTVDMIELNQDQKVKLAEGIESVGLDFEKISRTYLPEIAPRLLHNYVSNIWPVAASSSFAFVPQNPLAPTLLQQSQPVYQVLPQQITEGPSVSTVKLVTEQVESANDSKPSDVPETKRARLDEPTAGPSSLHFNRLLFATNTEDNKTTQISSVEEPTVQIDENEDAFEYQKTVQNAQFNCIYLKDGSTVVFTKEEDTRIITAVKRNFFLDDDALTQCLKELKESNLIQDELKNKFLKCRYLQLKENFMSYLQNQYKV